MRSLLRWTSLVASALVLYALGLRRLHLHDFNAFLMVLLALAVAIVIVHAITGGDEAT